MQRVYQHLECAPDQSPQVDRTAAPSRPPAAGTRSECVVCLYVTDIPCLAHRQKVHATHTLPEVAQGEVSEDEGGAVDRSGESLHDSPAKKLSFCVPRQLRKGVSSKKLGRGHTASKAESIGPSSIIWKYTASWSRIRATASSKVLVSPKLVSPFECPQKLPR
jgi:hypothetical protein